MGNAHRGGLAVFALALMTAGPMSGQASPASERRIVDRADRLQRSGRVDEARVELTGLLARAPASVEALSLLYELAEADGSYNEFASFAEAAALAAGHVGRIQDLWVRGLIGAGFADSARNVARRWNDAAPADELAVLAHADALAAAGDRRAAIEVLGDAGSGAPSRRLLLRHADLLIETGDLNGAAEVWVGLLTLDDPAIDEVTDDLSSTDDPTAALGRLASEIEGPGSPGRGAAALVALRLGDPGLARRFAASTSGDDRDQLLREYVREADLATEPAEVAWAAGQLIALSPRPVDKARWRAIAADRSLAAGDTATARAALSELAGSAEPGETAHGGATRRLFSLEASTPAGLTRASELLEEYALGYPDSMRARSEMYGELAEGHARAGSLSRGEAIISAARSLSSDPAAVGPLDATGGRLAFWAGARDSALVRTQRSIAQPSLQAEELTDRLRLLTALQVADSAEVAIAGVAAFELHRDPARYDVSAAARQFAGLPPTEGRATVLSYLGHAAAAAGRLDVASGLWRRVAEAYPESAEAPEVMLALARGTRGDEARGWLERLIVGYPESALAPVARRLLSEMTEGT